MRRRLTSEDSRRFIDRYWSDALGLVIFLNLMARGYRVDVESFLSSSTLWSEGKSIWGFMGGGVLLLGKAVEEFMPSICFSSCRSKFSMLRWSE